MPSLTYQFAIGADPPREVTATHEQIARLAQQRIATWMSAPQAISLLWPYLPEARMDSSYRIVAPGYAGRPAGVVPRRFAVDGILGPATLSMAKYMLDAARLPDYASEMGESLRNGRMTLLGMEGILRVAVGAWNPNNSRILLVGNAPMPSVVTARTPTPTRAPVPRTTPAPVSTPTPTPEPVEPPVAGQGSNGTDSGVGPTTQPTTPTTIKGPQDRSVQSLSQSSVSLSQPSTWPWYVWAGIGTAGVASIGAIAWATRPKKSQR